MTDLDRLLREDADRWQQGVDSGARPAGSLAPQGRSRSFVVVASALVVIAVLIGLSLTAALHHGAGRAQAGGSPRRLSPPVSALSGVTWSDPASPGTLVFGAGTVRVFDGCHNGVRALRVRSRTLTIGRPIGQQGTCGGLAGGPSTGVDRFDRVTRPGRLTWSLTGSTLVLTSSGGRSLTMRRNGAALSVTGQRWVLSRVQDKDNELPGSYHDATFVVRHNRVHATDLCNTITGNAVTTATTIRFSRLSSTELPCSPQKAVMVIDAVLRGSRTYAIRGDDLIIDGGDAGLLIYVPSS